jgi:Zn finger protein HypA/HybF involved in hydrogenase expression
MEPTQVASEEFNQAVNDYQGWCSTCHEFTRDMTEPDARGYDCPECGEDTVCGAEEALVEGLIEVGDMS